MSEPGSQGQPDEAMVDLLIKQVTEGLSPAEQRELDVLDSAVASTYLRDFERAAAAISLAAAPAAADALPPALRQRLEEQAQAHYPSVATGEREKVTEFRPAPARAEIPLARSSRGGGWGWLAAAACLVFAMFSWYRTERPSVAPVAEQHAPAPPVAAPEVLPPKEPPSPAEQRLALLAKPDSIKVTLAPTKDPAGAGVTGDAVWDPATQTGFLHFVGLAPNDPQVHQYQIWIFDGERDKRYPVDGGVFDVPADTTEVVIPIRAQLSVRKPAAFAVTVEKAGGVVVSSRSHVVALGAAG